MHLRHAKIRQQIGFRKGGQAFIGSVFFFGHHHHQFRACIVGKPEAFASAQHLIARDGRADVLFDVGHDQIGAGKVADLRWHGRIVHGVGQVPHQHHILSIFRHLPQAKRAAEHAHVHMHAHDHDILDAVRLQQVPVLPAVVGDGIAFGIDANAFNLPDPGGARVAAFGFQRLGPLRMSGGFIVFAAIRMIDGVASLFLCIVDPVHPLVDSRREVCGRGAAFARARAG